MPATMDNCRVDCVKHQYLVVVVKFHLAQNGLQGTQGTNHSAAGPSHTHQPAFLTSSQVLLGWVENLVTCWAMLTYVLR
jgi:hypothetical protein